MTPPRLVTFAGSTRPGSFNVSLVKAAAEMARAAGAEVTLADLRDYPMPLYDAEIEAAEGLPPGAKAFKALLAGHDGFLVASPEYNGSFTPLLKNSIDWASRREPSDPGPAIAYRGKIVGLMGASNGRLGGIRGLPHIRHVLTTLGAIVVPEQLALHAAADAFDGQGRLRDPQNATTLHAIVARVVALATSVRS